MRKKNRVPFNFSQNDLSYYFLIHSDRFFCFFCSYKTLINYYPHFLFIGSDKINSFRHTNSFSINVIVKYNYINIFIFKEMVFLLGFYFKKIIILELIYIYIYIL